MLTASGSDESLVITDSIAVPEVAAASAAIALARLPAFGVEARALLQEAARSAGELTEVPRERGAAARRCGECIPRFASQ